MGWSEIIGHLSDLISSPETKRARTMAQCFEDVRKWYSYLEKLPIRLQVAWIFSLLALAFMAYDYSVARKCYDSRRGRTVRGMVDFRRFLRFMAFVCFTVVMASVVGILSAYGCIITAVIVTRQYHWAGGFIVILLAFTTYDFKE